MIRERPILFSAPMVRAIIDGRKTQTRRAMKPQWPVSDPPPVPWTDVSVCGIEFGWPYGKPGDRLWVRETLSATHVGLEYAADNAAVNHDQAIALNDRYARFPPFELEPRLIPAIHMPRWAFRILLEVTDVRVQRLQEISEHDAMAEGCIDVPDPRYAEAWAELWESINGAGSWDANPWVWAISFKRILP